MPSISERRTPFVPSISDARIPLLPSISALCLSDERSTSLPCISIFEELSDSPNLPSVKSSPTGPLPTPSNSGLCSA